MSNCKNCHSSEVTKNGFVRSKQRYRCKTCGYNFVEGDERTNPQTTIKRAFAVILYSLAKASYGTIANLFNVSPSTVQKSSEFQIADAGWFHSCRDDTPCNTHKYANRAAYEAILLTQAENPPTCRIQIDPANLATQRFLKSSTR